jgi:hypothetical protein
VEKVFFSITTLRARAVLIYIQLSDIRQNQDFKIMGWGQLGPRLGKPFLNVFSRVRS